MVCPVSKDDEKPVVRVRDLQHKKTITIIVMIVKNQADGFLLVFHIVFGVESNWCPFRFEGFVQAFGPARDPLGGFPPRHGAILYAEILRRFGQTSEVQDDFLDLAFG